ncbi:unnamed protein product, partial [Symbiodinium natans]
MSMALRICFMVLALADVLPSHAKLQIEQKEASSTDASFPWHGGFYMRSTAPTTGRYYARSSWTPRKRWRSWQRRWRWKRWTQAVTTTGQATTSTVSTAMSTTDQPTTSTVTSSLAAMSTSTVTSPATSSTGLATTSTIGQATTSTAMSTVTSSLAAMSTSTVTTPATSSTGPATTSTIGQATTSTAMSITSSLAAVSTSAVTSPTTSSTGLATTSTALGANDDVNKIKDSQDEAVQAVLQDLPDNATVTQPGLLAITTSNTSSGETVDVALISTVNITNIQGPVNIPVSAGAGETSVVSVPAASLAVIAAIASANGSSANATNNATGRIILSVSRLKNTSTESIGGNVVDQNSAVAIAFRDEAGNILETIELPEPISFLLPTNNTSFECLFYDEILSEWSKKGVETSPDPPAGALLCLTTHLSIYAAGAPPTSTTTSTTTVRPLNSRVSQIALVASPATGVAGTNTLAVNVTGFEVGDTIVVQDAQNAETHIIAAIQLPGELVLARNLTSDFRDGDGAVASVLSRTTKRVLIT